MRDNQYPGRSVVMSTRGMIATSQPLATQAGLAVLQAGGNAMDAAIAASAVLCVAEPQATGIGGDCFLLYHEAKTGKLHGLNGSGRAPARATLEEFERRGLMQVPEFGMLSVIVPGAVDAWQMALGRFGTRSLEELLQPAIAYAEVKKLAKYKHFQSRNIRKVSNDFFAFNTKINGCNWRRTTDSGVSKRRHEWLIEKIDDTSYEASRKIFKFQISSSKTGKKDKEKITALVPLRLLEDQCNGS